MAASTLKTLALLAFVAQAAQAAPAKSALARDAEQPILLDAASTEVDLRTNNAIFNKVRISQGKTAVTADQAQATRHQSALDFENNLWDFRGNVRITMDQGQLTSDEAQITFVNRVLTRAVATGKPAAFEQVIAKTGKLAKGNAATVDYDVSHGIVRLSKDAYLSDGQNEIRGQSLKYDVRSQSVIADAAEQGSQRVHIIITPPPPKSAPAGAPPTNPNP
jgi:lipopolysaccharide export system protein LptA